MFQTKEAIRKPRVATKDLVMVSVLGAMSAILMLFSFQVPFVPPFIKMDFSEVPVLIGGLLLGPVNAIYIAVVKVVLNTLLNGSTSLGIGEMVNLLGSISYVLPVAIYYKKHPTKKGLGIGMIGGTAIVTIILLVINASIVFPLYAKVMNFPMEAIVQMTHAVNPLVKNPLTLFVYMLTPFNVLKYGLTSILGMILYSKINELLK